ncbi:MAG TPA: glycerol kinase, partial [Halieaceae bacterium]|nr:glycerol kinase [Halieaceae bacterium]
LAGLGERIWDSPEALSNVWRAEKVFEVGLGPEQRQQRLASWQSAVSKTLHT